jgi:glycosyltransferase involved in cell wall biosynthesis
MRVTHISPLAFGASGMWGGGERYPLELAKAMSVEVPTRFVTFGPAGRTVRVGQLEQVTLPTRFHLRGPLNPISERFLAELFTADVVHTHHYETLLTDVAILVSPASRNKIFCTDHGGRSFHLSSKLPLWRMLDGFLGVSRFSCDVFPKLATRASVIYGGVDTTRYLPDGQDRQRKAIFVGRLLPHKGLDVLIRALPSNLTLEIFGRAYDAQYLATLRQLAREKQVKFFLDADDQTVLRAYQSARVLVLPSVYRSLDGGSAPRSELLGLALLEAMACGTPVIASRVGGMPEIVDDGVWGAIVTPGAVEELHDTIRDIVDGSSWRAMSTAAVDVVRSRFTWALVADRCLRAYAGSP